MNPTSVIFTCAAIIAGVIIFVVIDFLRKRKNEKPEVSCKTVSQNSLGTTTKKILCYSILGAILIGSAMGTAVLIAFADHIISFNNPGPIIWGVGAGIMFLFKPLLYKLFNIKGK